jgi:hypothetical protein
MRKFFFISVGTFRLLRLNVDAEHCYETRLGWVVPVAACSWLSTVQHYSLEPVPSEFRALDNHTWIRFVHSLLVRVLDWDTVLHSWMNMPVDMLQWVCMHFLRTHTELVVVVHQHIAGKVPCHKVASVMGFLGCHRIAQVAVHNTD